MVELTKKTAERYYEILSQIQDAYGYLKEILDSAYQPENRKHLKEKLGGRRDELHEAEKKVNFS